MHGLVGHFRILGGELQNWMLLIGFVVGYIVAMEPFAESNSNNQK